MPGLEDELIALRREIHRFPELAGEERRTSALVAERLRALGLEVTTGVGGHGVVAVLDRSAHGPTLAYRADMDAVGAPARLPIPHSGAVFDASFTSQVPDVGHLCGHDLHVAIGVGVAATLAQSSDAIPGRIVFVFQPAEETLQGAAAMLEAGALLPHPPREIYALHCAPLPVGTLAVAPGYGLPGHDDFRITLTGASAAAATEVAEAAERLAAQIAELSTAPLPESAAEYARYFAEAAETDSPLRRFVHLRCGSAAVAADASASGDAGEGAGAAAEVTGYYRAWPFSRFAELRAQLTWLAEEAGGRIVFPSCAPFPGMVNSPELSLAAAQELRGVLGPEAVTSMHSAWPFSGEDFALFLEQVPGAMFWLGVADPAAGVNGAPHTPDFAADERAIGHGVRAMAALLTSRLAG